MNWADIVIMAVVLLAIIAGWRRGFIFGILDLFTWAGSFILGYVFYPYTAQWLEKVINLGVWLLPLSFLLTTLVARLLIGLITGFIGRQIHPSFHDGFNRFLGIIPGAINGWLYAVIFSALLLALPLEDDITSAMRQSRLGSKLAMQGEWANDKLAPVFNEAIKQTMNSLTVLPGSNEKVDLSFKTSKAVARPGLESEMLEMVNKERTKRGLEPLKADPELTTVARAHSQDMFARGYFAHNNPEGKNPFDRMKE
ncbi:MAG TPA: CvpA family protein, partial [Chitinophagaceae bacterium]|nr:CvpA family protein [Chitinophagaceae bacterium]